MGCNYELRYKPCPCCGASSESRHIGKSSYGWCFSLHVYPNESIFNLEDWEQEFTASGSKIFDEYGDEVSIDFMVDKITNRKFTGPPRRHDIDGRRCIGHGPGTYDYIVGEFS